MILNKGRKRVQKCRKEIPAVPHIPSASRVFHQSKASLTARFHRHDFSSPHNKIPPQSEKMNKK